MSLNKYAIKCQFCSELCEVVNYRKIVTCFNCKKERSRINTYERNQKKKKKE